MEIYTIELKGVPSNSGIISVDHHKYYDSNEKTAIGEKTSIEQIVDILGIQLSTFDMMIAANDVGYIPKMIKLADELGISEEEKALIIEHIDKLESIAKVPMQIGQPRTPIDEIPNIEQIAEETKQKNVSIAQRAVDQAYIYDDRFIWIDLEDFNCQREVTNILYKMGKYVDMGYNNIVISSIDKISNRRLVYFGNREIINELNQDMEDVKIRWTGGEPESGFFGVQLSEGEDFEQISTRMRYLLEERILGYHRIVKPEDIITSQETSKYGKNIRVYEIANPQTFYTAINTSQDNNAHSAFVHIYDSEEYAEKRLFLVNAGCVGCAVTKDGDIVSVFKNDNMAKKDDVEKISTSLLLTAIENGGKKLDCFDGFLPKNYMKHGFIPVCKVPFNDEFAPEDWNFERDGRPYIVFFMHNGKSVDQILKEKNEGTYTTYDLDSLPIIEDYDEAAQFRDEAIEREDADRTTEEKKEGHEHNE